MEDNKHISISAIYEKNKQTNKEKIDFWNFLMYSTKAEISITQLQMKLFWVGILEIFMFLVSFALVISYPKQLAWLLFLITHVIRGVMGLLLLCYTPKTSTVIEQLKDYESLSLNDIYNSIISSYKSLLSVNGKKIKTLMVVYWVFTGINVLEDLILFFCLIGNWGRITYNFKNIVSLVVIAVLFSKFIFIFVLILLLLMYSL